MAKEHLSVEVLEEAIVIAGEKLAKIKCLAVVDKGQRKTPSKQDYQNACLEIIREVDS